MPSRNLSAKHDAAARKPVAPDSNDKVALLEAELTMLRERLAAARADSRAAPDGVNKRTT